MSDRLPIPEPTKRSVRQRCGFGCVVCGLPLYEYHHIEDFAVVKVHEASNITLLCKKHHAEVTNGLMPKAKIREKNNKPHNLLNGQSSPYLLHYGTEPCSFVVGNNTITNNTSIENFEAVRIDGETIMGFRREDGMILTTFRCYDENDQEILQILDNELQYAVGSWDIEFVGKRLTLRQGKGKIIAQVLFEPPHKLVIERATIYRNGIGLLITENGFFSLNGGSGFSNCSFNNFAVGLGLGKVQASNAVLIPIDDEQRYKYADSEAIQHWLQWSKNPLGLKT